MIPVPRTLLQEARDVISGIANGHSASPYSALAARLHELLNPTPRYVHAKGDPHVIWRIIGTEVAIWTPYDRRFTPSVCSPDTFFRSDGTLKAGFIETAEP